MRKRKSNVPDNELGEEISQILEGDSDRSARGPEVFPGMEDHGIGSVRHPDSEQEAPESDETEETPSVRPVRRRSKGPYRFISGAFIILFLLMIAHLIRFDLVEKDDYVNSTYNSNRRTKIASLVRRGSIVSSDGVTLAYSKVDDEGNEVRVYPYANEYAHVVGYTTTHDTSGIESFAAASLLTSHSNIIDQIINDFRGEKNLGDTVVTTLDSKLQDICYQTLGSYNGAIIVLEPKTGAIRAMVSQPGFDPNTLEENWSEITSDTDTARLWNRATQGLYAPGSTFKIITALSYYRKYRTLDNFSFECTGELEAGDYTAHCYEYAVHGEEDFTTAFANSCNTAFAQIGLDLGISQLTKTANSLMFGESLPSDISAGKARWNLTTDSGEEELVMTAFGQGRTQVTPYYMALLVSAIANDGTLMKPYLVDHVESTTGTVISQTSVKTSKTLMSEQEAEILTDLMEAVVQKGSASRLYGRGYEVAGKTGSAEYYKSDGTIGTNSWFVGFTGGDDPDLAIVILAEDGGAGSSTAVPMAASILDSYYGR